jgi:hypothetical protein
LIGHISERSLAADGKQLQPREDICESGFKKTPSLVTEKGVITDAEFKQKLLEERAVYQRILNRTTEYLSMHIAILPRLKLTLFVLAF